MQYDYKNGKKEKKYLKKGKTFLKHTVSQQHVYYIDRSGFALKSWRSVVHSMATANLKKSEEFETNTTAAS